MNRLAEKIRDARIKAGLTELELAKKCGLQVAYVLQVESGKKIINEQIADQILKKLGTQVDSFSDIAHQEAQEASKSRTSSQPVRSQAMAHSTPLAPTAQWSNALKQLVYEVPVMNLGSTKVIESIPHPVIDNKVEGYHGEKLYYLKLQQDALKDKRLKKDDYVLLLKTKQLTPNKVMHFIYQNKHYLGIIQTKDKKEVIIKSDAISRVVKQSDLDILGQALRVTFKLN